MSAKTLLQASRPSWRAMAPGIAAGVASGLSAVLLLGLSAYLITRAAEQPPILYLGLLVVGVRAFALSRGFFRYLERLSTHDAAFRALSEVRVDALERLEPLAPAQLGPRRRGDLLTRVIRDVDELTDLPTRVLQPLVSTGVVLLVSLGAVAYLSWPAALVFAGVLTLAAVLGTLLGERLTSRAERSTADLRGRLADAVVDLVADLDVLIAYGAAQKQLDRVRAVDTELRRTALRSALGTGITSSVLTLGMGATVLLVLWLLAPGVLGPGVLPSLPLGPDFVLEPGRLDPPTLAVLTLLPLALFEAAVAVPAAWTARRRVLTSAARIAEIAPARHDTPGQDDEPGQDEEKGQNAEARESLERQDAAERDRPRDGVPSGSSERPALELMDFTVHWPGREEPVSLPITLELEAGEVALVDGPSGAGKSALSYGLVRFLQHRGTFRLRGVAAEQFSDEQLRRRVCLIEQRSHLFDSSLRNNLALAHPQGSAAATDEELMAAVRAVGLEEWASSRHGLDTAVGMFGSLVSGGQAQRIAVARGLLSRAEILVLDEPTAHVDAETADAVLDHLLGSVSAMGDGVQRSIILISHTVPRVAADHRLTVSSARNVI